MIGVDSTNGCYIAWSRFACYTQDILYLHVAKVIKLIVANKEALRGKQDFFFFLDDPFSVFVSL